MLIAFLLWETRKWIPSGINPSVNKKSQECAAGRVPTTQKGRVEAYAKKGSGIFSLPLWAACGTSPCACVCTLPRVWLFVTPRIGPTRLLCPWNFPGKNTGLGCHFLLQRIFPTQGLNLCLLGALCWQAHSFPLHHLGRPWNFLDQGSNLLPPTVEVQSLHHWTNREVLKEVTLNVKTC